MKPKLFALVLLVNLLMSGAAFSACETPEEPAIPDGESANGSEMLKGKKDVEAYVAAMEEYLKCSRLSVSRHNSMIDKMQDVAGKFNVQVRAYKAKA